MKRLMKSNKFEKGFTLIELLIAMTILGILAAVVVPNVTNYVGSGKLSAANNELDSVKAAILAFGADDPTTFAAGSVGPNADVAVTDPLGPYMSGHVQGAYSWDANGGWAADPTYSSGATTFTYTNGKFNK
jgi:prepilin-type N-terminal cleavage/methylation domain-containing protein